ncbi:hypothetical protein O181_018849 [Austropuccinia psidii MF-1]|uniref:Reverse transcriptase domain-containing protein n=1 Tax=Austropuccinia psidii MF-1 TaxID=1389203 RepID=A0A9Q3C8F5_9BASI|nr:hypothetical protein [Austropuccinia psidii MF-1]
MPFGVENSPPHYKTRMNTIFPTELSEGWLIIYSDDIIISNYPDSPEYVPLEVEQQIRIEGISITDIGTEFFEEVSKSYKQDKNFHILRSLVDKDCKDTDLLSSFDEEWKAL